MNWRERTQLPNPHNMPFYENIKSACSWFKDCHLMDLNDQLMARNVYTPYARFLYGVMYIYPAQGPLKEAYKRERNLIDER